MSTAKTSDFSGTLFYNPAGPGFNAVAQATIQGPTSFNEGATTTFRLVTWGIPDGTPIFWAFSASEIAQGRITSSNTNTVVNHRATCYITVSADNATASGTQLVNIFVVNANTYSNVATLSGIVVNDTSQSLPASLAFVIGLNNYKEVAGTTTDWALSTTWTIEFWSNCAQASSGAPLTIMSQNIGGGAIDIHYLSGSLTVNNDRVLCAEPTAGIWTHVALVCDGGNGLTVYYNGASVYTGLAYELGNNSNTLVIGKRAQNNFQYFNGHLAGIRITNTAVYTGTFNPLTVALPPAKIAGTKLLINSTVGTSVVDSSDSAHTLVNGTVATSEYYPPTIQLTSGSSLAFNGTDNRHVVVSGSQSDWNLGANWTMEWWQKIPVDGGNFLSVLCQDANISPYAGIDVFVHDNKIQLFNSNMLFDISPRAPPGRWNHIAVQKDGTTVKGFINGYQVEVLSMGGFNSNIVPSSPLNVVIGSRTPDGGANFYGQYFNGELSNIRISNIARYTGIFTPPTTVVVDVNTKLALSGQVGGNGMLDDVSASNHNIDNYGAVVIPSISPVGEFVFQNAGGSNYSIDGNGFPTLTLIRGGTYTFDLSQITASYPWALRLSNGDTSVVPGTTGGTGNGGSGNNTINGVFGTSPAGTVPSTIVYQVPLDAPSSIVYQCVYVSPMIGTINIEY